MEEFLFPLELYSCKNCGHVQLGHIVDKKHLYQTGYHYVSSTSKVFVKHFDDYASHVIEKFKIKKNSLIIDIGSITHAAKQDIKCANALIGERCLVCQSINPDLRPFSGHDQKRVVNLGRSRDSS